LHGDWSPRTDDGSGSWNDHTVGGIGGQVSSERAGKDVGSESTSTSISGGSWDGERGTESPDMDTRGSWGVGRS
jgi:hypothetical protein